MDNMQKIVMVTPYAVEDDNTNPTARNFNIAAVVLLCLTRFSPVITSFSFAFNEYGDASFNPSISVLLFIAAIIVMVVSRIKFPKNCIGKGLLIGTIMNFVVSILVAILAFIIVAWIIGMYSAIGWSDLLWELMEVFD